MKLPGRSHSPSPAHAGMTESALGQEDFLSMVVEICPLLREEAVGPPVGRGGPLDHTGRLEDELVEAKASQVFTIDPGRNVNFSLILEADEPAAIRRPARALSNQLAFP